MAQMNEKLERTIKKLIEAKSEDINSYLEFLDEKITYTEFSLWSVKRNMNLPTYHEFYIEHLIENESNKLPKSSSGSFYSAITDIDNFMASLEDVEGMNEFLSDYDSVALIEEKFNLMLENFRD